MVYELNQAVVVVLHDMEEKADQTTFQFSFLDERGEANRLTRNGRVGAVSLFIDAKAIIIRSDGQVIDVLSSGIYRVKLENGTLILAQHSSRMQKNRRLIRRGDTVAVEISSANLKTGRIIPHK